MYKIIDHTGHVESTLTTPQAANNRLRMLKKYDPYTDYHVEAVRPKFTVTPIPR